MKNFFNHFLRDIIPVIVGILIALAINNWNEERKQKKFMLEMLNSIQYELDETKADIEKKIPMQKKLTDSLKFYMTDNQLSIFEIVEKAEGVHTPFIKTNSWITLANSKIELVAFEKISILSTIEDGKGIYMQKLNYLLEVLYSSFLETSKKAKLKLMFIITDIISTEYSIKEDIEKYQELNQ